MGVIDCSLILLKDVEFNGLSNRVGLGVCGVRLADWFANRGLHRWEEVVLPFNEETSSWVLLLRLWPLACVLLEGFIVDRSVRVECASCLPALHNRGESCYLKDEGTWVVVWFKKKKEKKWFTKKD